MFLEGEKKMKNYSDLELLVMYDMYENGFDPANPTDVMNYWNERL